MRNPCSVNTRIMEEKTSEKSYTCNIFSPSELEFMTKYLNTSTMKDMLSQLEMRLEGISNFSSTKNLLEQSERFDNDYIMLSWFLKSMAAKYLCNEKRRGFAWDSVC